MESKLTSYTLDTLPEVADSQLARLRSLAERPDSEIDFSDIPEMTQEKSDTAMKFRGTLFRPLKRQITARVDADVLEWLKSQGKGYQSRINAILRREMLQARQQR